MFTGIIQAIGKIVERHQPSGGDVRLGIGCGDLDLQGVQIGDSIAVNGACLTAVELGEHSFVADVSQETLQRTSLGQLSLGQPGQPGNRADPANRARRAPGQRPRGRARQPRRNGNRRALDPLPVSKSKPELQHYIAVKGSVTLDGTSLTVNGVDANRFDVNIVPHTQQRTIFHTIPGGHPGQYRGRYHCPLSRTAAAGQGRRWHEESGTSNSSRP